MSLKKSARFNCALALLLLGVGTVSSRAQTTFTVTNVGFSAYNINGLNNPTLSLTRGVVYTFNVNAAGHPFWIKTISSTGTLNAYTNGVVNNGAQVGTLSFAVPSNAPNTLFYNCQFHIAMSGAINITPPVFPPSVAITNPTSGTTLAEPATFTLRASATDSDGIVTNVQFFSGRTLLGSASTAPYFLTLSNLPAGSYPFTAQAVDNTGLSGTSAVVSVSVVTPDPIRFDTNLVVLNGQLPLRLSVTSGLRYELDYTSTWTNWLFCTNFVATNSVMSFATPVSSPNPIFFRAQLLPNP